MANESGMYLDETTFNDGATTTLCNSAINHLVSLRAYRIPISIFCCCCCCFSSLLMFYFLASGLSLLISLLFFASGFVYIELSFPPRCWLWERGIDWQAFSSADT